MHRLDQISAHFGIVKPKKKFILNPGTREYFTNFGKPYPMAVNCASTSWPLVQSHILILFHLRRDQRLITTKPYLFTIGQMFNPSSMNNLEFREFALSLSNHASLYSWASDAGRAQRCRPKKMK